MLIFKYFIIFTLIAFLITVPMLLFVRGFLLSKDVFSDKNFDSEGVINDLKIVLLIVDALRYDFVQWVNLESNVKPYSNKMVNLNSLIKNHVNNTILYEFFADPPTTTLQRLKALTTGSLPTFLDMKSNFWATEIDEDNIIDQIINVGRNIVFVGDDTWTRLYPNRFVREVPYSSFDVWDLDTVDDGVIKEFDVELSKDDWTILIGHMLGIDHTGHTFGPLHHLMPSKLKQVDLFIKDIVQRIDNNTVLFIFGDHGMTESGDHGGSSYAEISAALVVYSHNETIIDYFDKNITKIHQIDIVPTISHLLNIPIPYSNLGVSLLTQKPNAKPFYLRNVKQVYRYFRRFPKISSFSYVQAIDILNNYDFLYDIFYLNDSDFIEKARNYILTIQKICRNRWVQFGYNFMFCGIIFLSLILFYLIIIIFCFPKSYLYNIFNYKLLIYTLKLFSFISFILFLLFYYGIVINLIIFINLIIILLIPFIFLKEINLYFQINFFKFINFQNLFSLFIFLLSNFAILSNSFIIHENYLHSYFTCGSIGLLLLMNFGMAKRNKRIFWKSYLKSENGKLILSILILLLQIKFSTMFWICREEHGAGCVVLKENSPIFTIFSIISIIFLITTMQLLLQRYFPSVIKSKFVKSQKYLCFLCFILILFIWTFKMFDLKNLNFMRFLITMITLILCTLNLFITFIRSLLIYFKLNFFRFFELKNVKVFDEKMNSRFYFGCVHEFYNFSLSFILWICVIVGESRAIVIVNCFLSIFLISYILSNIKGDDSNIFLPTVIWSLLTSYWFYGTGHQPAFPNIRWNTVELTFGYFGAVLIISETFSSYLIHNLFLPTCVLFEYILKNNTVSNDVHHILAIRIIAFIVVQSFRVLFCLICALIHRRHLMVWKIFTPKLIFECISLIISFPFLLIGYLFAEFLLNNSKYYLIKE